MAEPAFTPALGRFAPVRFYDAVASLTRERVWRGHVVGRAALRDDDVVVDVGCGTGSLALLLREAQPEALVVGVDPDPGVLAIARRKAQGAGAGAALDLRRGMGDALEEILGPGSASVVVSSLLLHQCPLDMKRDILASMHAVLRPGGRLVIADYGLQRTRSMRTAFRLVQFADGRENTQPNAEGVLPTLISDAGFSDAREAEVVPTITGSISIYVAGRS